MACLALFHRSLLEFFDLWELSEDHFAENEHMAHDQWISFLSSLFNGTVTIDDILVHYRQHERNVIGIRPISTLDAWGVIKTNLLRFRTKGALNQRRELILWNIRTLLSAATAREKIIEKIIPRVGEETVQSLLSKRQYYREYRKYQLTRLSAYLSTRRTERIRAILSMLRHGLFRKSEEIGLRIGVVWRGSLHGFYAPLQTLVSFKKWAGRWRRRGHGF